MNAEQKPDELSSPAMIVDSSANQSYSATTIPLSFVLRRRVLVKNVFFRW